MIRTLLHHLRRPNPDALFDLRRPSDNWHWHRDSASIQPGNQPRTIE